MKILCAYSGVQFSVEHFPASLSARECVHPIFYVQQKKLLGYLPKWVAGELTDTDSYLYFLALLHSTELIEWRVPAIRTDRTKSIIANNMESLVHVVGKINLIKHPSFVLSKIAITPESKSLDTAHYWIENWKQAYLDFENGYRQSSERERLKRREDALQKIIKDPNKPISTLARNLADWACDAGVFPTFKLTIEGKETTCSEYWKTIIIKCCKDEAIFSIPKADIQELIDHCEDNIEAGSIYHYSLMTLLRNGLQKQSNYLGLGDIDISTSTYRILDADTSIEDANKLAMIDSAPTEIPRPENYPSKIAYLRAKVKYDMAQEYKKSQDKNQGESK